MSDSDNGYRLKWEENRPTPDKKYQIWNSVKIVGFEGEYKDIKASRPNLDFEVYKDGKPTEQQHWGLICFQFNKSKVDKQLQDWLFGFVSKDSTPDPIDISLERIEKGSTGPIKENIILRGASLKRLEIYDTRKTISVWVSIQGAGIKFEAIK